MTSSGRQACGVKLVSCVLVCTLNPSLCTLVLKKLYSDRFSIRIYWYTGVSGLKDWSVCSSLFIQNLTYEVILTLGQAFEVAYQLALQDQRTKQHQPLPVGPASEIVETKSSRPVPKPRGSVRKSAVSRTFNKMGGCPV